METDLGTLSSCVFVTLHGAENYISFIFFSFDYLFFLVVDCGNPGSPAHGNRDSSNVFTYDASASFTCDPGYELVGEQSIKCQGDGTWSSSIPVCRREWTVPVWFYIIVEVL